MIEYEKVVHGFPVINFSESALERINTKVGQHLTMS